MGGPGLRRRRLARRLAVGAGLALLALSAAAAPVPCARAAQEPASWTARVARLERPVYAGEAGAAEELRRLFDELAPSVLEDPGASEDGRLALLHAGLLLSATAALRGEDPEEALRWIEAVLPLVDPARDSPGWIARVDYELASRLVAVGQLETAAEVLADSLAHHAAGTPYELATRHLLAEALRKLARWSEAEAELDALEARLADPSLPASTEELWRARLHGSRGQLLLGVGLIDRAAHEHALEGRAARASGDPQAQVVHVLNRIDLGLLAEDYEGVEALLTQAAGEPFHAGLDPARRALLELYLGVARCQLEREQPSRPPQAEATLERALAAPALPRNERLIGLRFLAILALRRGDLGAARAALDEVRRQLDGEERTQGHDEERAFLAALEAQIALAAGQPDVPEDRRRELERRLADLRAGWTLLLGRWARTPVRPGGVGFLHHSARRELLGTLARLSVAVLGPEAGAEAALEALLETEVLGSHARRRGLPRASLAEVRRELLQEGHGVLVYLPSRERSHLLALDRGRARLFDLSPWADYRDELQELLADLRRDPSTLGSAEERERLAAELEAEERALSATLLPPEVQEWIAGWRAVSVLGTDHLRGLPPELLRVQGRTLGTSRAVDVLPSLTLGLSLARQPSPPARSADAPDLVLVVTLDPGEAAARRWPGLQRIPLQDGLVERLSRPFPRERVRVLAGSAADRAGVLAAPLADAPLVHFLVHGAYATETERGAVLVLSGGTDQASVLTCEDVEGLRVSGTVLLSACATARGPGRPGDDALANLGGAFLAAGARVVVLARAPIELEPTLVLMETLQERLDAGDTLAEALRAGRVAAAEGADALVAHSLAQISAVGLGQRPAF